MEHSSTTNVLPENAYRELKPNEVYTPVMLSTDNYPEVTGWSVFWGLVMAVIFSAAAAYSGLKVGQVFEAAIPISILAVGLSTAFKIKNSLGQNVIIQSIGATSGVIVAGAIFTLPALYVLKLDVNFWFSFISSALGGFMGILFLIPFRKYFVKEMHGKFPFPEATATTEILMTGEKGGSDSKVLIVSGLIGGLFDFIITSLGLWSETVTTRMFGLGHEIAEKTKLVFKLDILSMIFGLGYIVGLRYSIIIAAGSLLSWFVLVPLMLVPVIGKIAAGAAIDINFANMSAEAIFKGYVRHIGIGGIAMAGIIGIIKSSKIIRSAFGLAVSEIFGGSKSANDTVIRTDTDLRMNLILTFIILTIAAIFVFFLFGIQLSLTHTIVALITVVVITFLFTTVAANAIAIVGTNPVSGMTLMTLILSSVILTQFGLNGTKGMMSALIIGGIVCTALSTAGGFITDLKIGYWLGSTPVKQQRWKFLGTLLSAATVAGVIYILNSTYGFISSPEHANPLAAPQANAMAAVISPLMQSDAKINWILYIAGAIIALIANFLKISPLAFALGMYLPLELNTPLVIGGLVSHFIMKSSKDEKLNIARNARGTLIASGFIAGGALFGVGGAILRFLGLNMMNDVFAETWQAQWVGLLMYVLVVFYAYWDAKRAKV
ncbi:MAG: oligopeptide transporter, OPT family [Candidatus Kapabacteria bacterium]|nr:oligopeptide transporter, OPT family [Candidatus Kapabacteria bacterium]